MPVIRWLLGHLMLIVLVAAIAYVYLNRVELGLVAAPPAAESAAVARAPGTAGAESPAPPAKGKSEAGPQRPQAAGQPEEARQAAAAASAQSPASAGAVPDAPTGSPGPTAAAPPSVAEAAVAAPGEPDAEAPASGSDTGLPGDSPWSSPPAPRAGGQPLAPSAQAGYGVAPPPTETRSPVVAEQATPHWPGITGAAPGGAEPWAAPPPPPDSAPWGAADAGQAELPPPPAIGETAAQASATPAERLEAARRAYWEGQLDVAEREYRALLESQGASPPLLVELAAVLVATGRPQAAADRYAQAALALARSGRHWEIGPLVNQVFVLDYARGRALEGELQSLQPAPAWRP